MANLEVPFELKAVDEAGNFEGYAAVFNNVDLGDDVILPGAFTRVKQPGAESSSWRCITT